MSQSPPPDSDATAVSATSANNSTGGLARNALISYFATFAGTITGFFVTPLLIKYLGEDHFGLWVLLGSVIGYLALLEVGLYTTVSTRVARCLTNEDDAEMKRVLGTAFALYAALAGLVLLLALGLASWAPQLFHLAPADRSIASLCLLVLGLNQVIALIFRLQPAILFGGGRLDITLYVAAGSTTLTAIGYVLLAFNGYSIVALAANTTLLTLLGGLVTFQVIRRRIPFAVLDLRQANRATARDLLRFSSRNAALSVAGTIAYGADTLVIGLLLPVANVAHYAIAQRLSNLIGALAQKPIDVLLPAYSDAETRGDRDRQFQLWTESIALATAISLPFVIAAVVLGDRLIEAWVGAGHEASYPILVALALTLLLLLPGHASSAIMVAAERNLALTRIYMVAAPINLLLSFVLTRAYGPVGVALGSLLTVAVVDFQMLPRLVCRQWNFEYRTYLARGLAPLLAPSLVTSLLAFALRQITSPGSRLLTVLLLVVVVVVCWTTWLAVGLDATRREAYVRRFQQFPRRRTAPEAQPRTGSSA